MEGQRRNDLPSLKSKRLSTIDKGLYMILDWYVHVKDQPLTCIIQVNQDELKESGERIKLPNYLQIERDVTDHPDFTANALTMRIDPALLED